MKWTLIFTACLLPAIAFGLAENNGPNPGKRTVQCTILDASTGEALTGVQVQMEGLSAPLWSDEAGLITLEIPSNSLAKITCSLVSFESRSVELVDAEGNTIIYLSEK